MSPVCIEGDAFDYSVVHSSALIITPSFDVNGDFQVEIIAAAGTGTITVPVEVIGELPDGQSSSFSFTVTVSENICLLYPITPSTMDPQFYDIGAPEQSYEVPEFGYTVDERCPVEYEVSFDPALTWISV